MPCGAVRPLDGTRPNRPFLWTREDGMRLLSAPGEGNTWFDDVNDQGQAVGNFEVRAPVPLEPIVSRAFLWTPQEGFQALAGLTD
ncbi:MAG: hypothetical protein HY721_23420 [Planctomycetes bacterium]|nr:hypothetical protein [Planctomycetota bacterium]